MIPADFLSILPILPIISYLPICVLDGLFLYMGVASFGGNSFYERILLFITDKQRRYARTGGILCAHHRHKEN